jgi:hypothetical protein
VVQFWLRPGDDGVALNFTGRSDVGNMPNVLKGL